MSETTTEKRPPVVAIMGHVDHGKSTLLDYIRKSNIVEGEAGGITQHIAAYEVEAEAEGETRKITFIDTPGHAAFTGMRECGASAADIAILIVSAEDSVKAQTEEAIKTITEGKVPFIVAINKIDRPNANPDKVKTDLLEHNVYVEGFGGDIPVVPISAKTGEGVDDLLETILLLADMEGFTGTTSELASGFVIESHLDPKRGVSATIVIKDGSLTAGQFIVAGTSLAKTRLVEDHLGKQVKAATFSAPLTVIGFDTQPAVGQMFQVYDNKKDAEAALAENQKHPGSMCPPPKFPNAEAMLPLVVKADTIGTLAALQGEIEKISTPEFCFKIIKTGIGDVNESDLQIANADEDAIIVGFSVGVDKKVRDSNDAQTVTIKTFDIIYKLTEWLEEEHEKRRPRKTVDKVTGAMKVLKVFSSQKDKHVAGGRVLEGELSVGNKVRIVRRENVIAHGTITNIEQAKSKITTVKDGEFGLMIEAKLPPAEGDTVEAITQEIV